MTNPVDEYAQHLGHLHVQWQREAAARRQTDGQFRATAAELQKANARIEELERLLGAAPHLTVVPPAPGAETPSP